MENINLDETDRKILRELQSNGRLSAQELSERVGLSPSPCSRRMKILEEKGIIRGYSVLIDEAKLGYTVSVFVSVRLDRQIDDALKTFESTVKSYPEVVDCWLMTGNRDFLLRLSTENLVEFEEFLTSRLTKIPGVASIESSIPLRRIKGGMARTL